jgi:hypothetical protein
MAKWVADWIAEALLHISNAAPLAAPGRSGVDRHALLLKLRRAAPVGGCFRNRGRRCGRVGDANRPTAAIADPGGASTVSVVR